MTFAFLFFDSVGGGEWLVLLAVVLIVIGPRNLPAAARKMGQTFSKLRRAADEFKRQIMTMDQEMERAVNDVKNDYIDVADDVNETVSGDGEDSGAGPGGDLGDGEDRAYDYYGEDGYDETGEMYSDAPPMMGEGNDGQDGSGDTAGVAPSGTSADAAPSGTPADAAAQEATEKKGDGLDT
jgi:Tat protein translocase TatB subunit